MTSAHAIYLEQLAANASYASLACILAAVVFVVASIGMYWVLRISSALGLAIAANLVLLLRGAQRVAVPGGHGRELGDIVGSAAAGYR